MLAEISVAMAMRSPLEALGAGPGWRGGAGSSVAMQSAAEFVVHADVGGLRRRWWPSKDAATPKRIADKARIRETRGAVQRGTPRRRVARAAPDLVLLLLPGVKRADSTGVVGVVATCGGDW